MSTHDLAAIKDVTKHSRTIDIENGPTLPAGYPRGEFDIEAWRITFEWTTDTAPSMVHVSGPRILKSGALGSWRSVSYVLGETATNAVWPAPPAWITDLIS
jgi:hypothetical protein